MVTTKKVLLTVFVIIPCLFVAPTSESGILFPGSSRDESNEGRSCTTPDDQPGECIPIPSCPLFKDNQNVATLLKYSCGFEGLTPKVCCQIKTTVGSGSEGNESPSLRVADAPSILPKECGVSEYPSTRIVGGTEADVGAWPWMAAIFFRRGPVNAIRCGGVLVSRRHVLTAAHCLYNLPRRRTRIPFSNLVVRLGEHDLDNDNDRATPIDVPIQSYIEHPNFELKSHKNDIAILKLAYDVEFKPLISPICLPFDNLDKNEDLTGKHAFIAGWGAKAFEGPQSRVLNQVQIRILRSEICENAYSSSMELGNTVLCGGYEEGGKDACQGDSGGPLMLPVNNGGKLKFYLIGIVSFGKECAKSGAPGVYTKVNEYMDWLAENLS